MTSDRYLCCICMIITKIVTYERIWEVSAIGVISDIGVISVFQNYLNSVVFLPLHL